MTQKYLPLQALGNFEYSSFNENPKILRQDLEGMKEVLQICVLSIEKLAKENTAFKQKISTLEESAVTSQEYTQNCIDEINRKIELTFPNDEKSKNSGDFLIEISNDNFNVETVEKESNENTSSKNINSNPVSRTQNIPECVVCLEDATHVITTCGHFCLCENCGKMSTKCPLCRNPYNPEDNLLRIYMS
jgi:Zinc finger, C3HC4 type (RING finger)